MKVIQGSKKLETAMALTICGGYLDAYTYFVRGGVFANAQTGNIIKLGIQLVNGSFETSVRYLVPVISFVCGVVLSMAIDRWMGKRKINMIRRTVLLVEALVLIAVGLIPAKEEYNLIANTMVSFVCAMQMETFTKFENQVIATTVSTGNLRKAAEFVFKALTEKNREDMKIAFMYILIIALFVFGVVFGTWTSDLFGIRSVWIAAALLVIGIVIITRKTEYLPESAA